MSNTIWNWKAKRERSAFLALEDGTVLPGYSIGAPVDRLGEVVFNTGMTGYQEILTDPSYAGQFVTMTCPEIGNTGINAIDHESRKAFANGFIVHELNPPANWRSDETLDAFLIREGIPAIAGIDTRALTTRLRSQGTLKGFLCVTGAKTPDDAVRQAKEWPGLDGQDYAALVTCAARYDWENEQHNTTSWGLGDDLPPVDMHVVAYDFGIKWNILRNMRLCGIRATVVPAKTPAKEVLAMRPDAVFYSNGPADPAAISYAIANAREFIGKAPIMGICLGHQLLGLACDAKTYRLKFGHHGCNHPVKNMETGSVEITSQNHNFALDASTIDANVLEVTHVNLNDNTVEGIRHKKEPMFAIQYHPEAAPGPHDPKYLFQTLREMVSKA